jgi:hypothetical protein
MMPWRRNGPLSGNGYAGGCERGGIKESVRIVVLVKRYSTCRLEGLIVVKDGYYLLVSSDC